MILKILSHPILIGLDYHMPIVVDLSHPLILLTGENGCGKSTLLHSIYHALRGDFIEGYVYRVDNRAPTSKIFLFDAEQHNPRMHLDLFEDNLQMKEFVSSASHGQVMLSMFNETFPGLPERTVLLLDEPEMALSISSQRRVLKMLIELIDLKQFRIVCATHSQTLVESPETYVINLDNYINRNVIRDDQSVEGTGTIQ